MRVVQQVVGNLWEVGVALPPLAVKHLPELWVKAARLSGRISHHFPGLAVEQKASALEGVLAGKPGAQAPASQLRDAADVGDDGRLEAGLGDAVPVEAGVRRVHDRHPGPVPTGLQHDHQSQEALEFPSDSVPEHGELVVALGHKGVDCMEN